ncbi:MAG: ABC transporter permease [Saprospiraceae bacterium]|nr:ABC transporter permease [Saprospiraceae bacterium]
MDRFLFNLVLAIDGVLMNKLRAFLTALGIIFGVAAVIAMLAIGEGAKAAILDQLKLIGSNSIVVQIKKESISEDEAAEGSGTSSDSQKEGKTKWSPGLRVSDVEAIRDVVPTVEKISPEVIMNKKLLANHRQGDVRCVGITADFFSLNNIPMGSGRDFSRNHHNLGSPVCIIGRNIQKNYFQQRDPIGQTIKVGNTWLRIIGVLERRITQKENLDKLGIRDYNSDVYVPLQTALIRFENRAKITNRDVGEQGQSQEVDSYNQLDRLVVRVHDTKQLQATADVISRMLKRRHQGLVDFEMEIPELLLQQQQKTQETFNLVLAVIAGISLLVGGIGIMNIMLASVLERIKEIGVRRSLGAQRIDIVLQFLLEAILISLIGGLIGIFLGLFSASLIARSAEIPTVVSGWSVAVSFGVAFIIGLVFGLIPAQRAAMQDPIKALRTD